MAEIMGFPLGVCPTHGPKLSVNGVPTCIKCQADEANKDRVLVINDAQDPGAVFFEKGVTNVPKPSSVAVLQKPVAKTVLPGIGYETGLQQILGILAVIPMPSSMKQYKLLMSVKQKIESALQEG